jgi:hypothetical protein
MSDTFVIRSQLGHFYSKSKVWTDGREAQVVAQFKYRDEALNTLVELSSKDVELRAEIYEPELTETGKLVLAVSEHPLPGDAQESIPQTI